MQQIGQEFRAWILEQGDAGVSIAAADASHFVLNAEKAQGQVTFYELAEGEPEIVELRIQRAGCDCEDIFFLHFELEDEERAQELFQEMLDVLHQASESQTTRVLLCCTSGMTTTMFAAKLAEAAASLSLDFQFDALPLEQALAQGADYAAIMLAPQVGYRRKEVAAAYPDKVVFEVPAKIFGAFDAASTLHLLLSTLDEDARSARAASPDTRIERDLSNDKRIMVISVVHRVKSMRIGYRVYEGGQKTLDGRVYKQRVDYRDVEDLAAAVRMMGLRVEELDAIGIAFPAAVNEQGAIQDTWSGKCGASGLKTYDLKERLESRYGVPTFVDNNANAATVGCYVTQDDFENIVLLTQRTGHPTPGLGTIVEGSLVRGRQGAAGEMGFLAKRLASWDERHELCWSTEGMCRLVADYLTSSICNVAPQAIYVAVEMIPDMDVLREELRTTLPETFMPELIAVDDYHERIMLGELALCLHGLNMAAAEQVA